MGLVLALAVALGGGFLATALLRPAPGASPAALLCTATLGAGLGLGASSVAWFLWLIAVGPTGTGFILTECALVVLLAALGAMARRRHRESPPSPGVPSSAALGRSLAAAMALLLLSGLIIFSVQWSAQPHGPGDAWAIWNLRARFLYRGGKDWRAGFGPELLWSHPDYPLLVPAGVARCWTYLGHEATLAPAVFGLVFTLAVVGVLGGTVALLRGRTQGLLASLVLVGTAFFLRLGSGQMADVPLAFFILAAVAPLCLHDRPGAGAAGGLVLAGTMAGLAAWTKNEGLLFVACLVPARLVTRSLALGWRKGLGELPALLLGLLPPLLLVAGFKTLLAPPNDLVAGQGTQATLGRLGDLARYRVIGASFGEALLLLGPGAVAGLLLAFALLGRAPRAVRPAGALPLLTLVLMLLGYLAVYVTTPNDLHWHLETSVARLVMHLWPLALLWYFLVVATPEEAALSAAAATGRSASPRKTPG
jgi:hypothetical protein